MCRDGPILGLGPGTNNTCRTCYGVSGIYDIKMSDKKKVRNSHAMSVRANCMIESDRSNNVSKSALENKISRLQFQKSRGERNLIFPLCRKWKIKYQGWWHQAQLPRLANSQNLKLITPTGWKRKSAKGKSLFHYIIYRIWSNKRRGYWANYEIEDGLLLLLKSSLIEIAEFS